VVAFLVFGIGDRVLGPEWSVTAETWVKESFWGTIPLENPMLWLLFGLVIWAVIFMVTWRQQRVRNWENEVGWTSARVAMHQVQPPLAPACYHRTLDTLSQVAALVT